MALIFTLILAYTAVILSTLFLLGDTGVVGSFLAEHGAWKVVIYYVLLAHLTITMMSLSFHRYHTHKGVIINKHVDRFMQLWLWAVTGMAKRDWVSIHLYHHAYSDKEKDPHSPVQKGFWRIFLFGVYDYIQAKDNPEVIRIKNNIAADKIELFYEKFSLLGILLLSVSSIVLLGPLWGSLISLLHFSVSPLFAIGGVNALAHTWGYKNHKFHDNSRNIGFLFPLNFIICGELDHNNHHSHPKSSSFRHRWYEFDIGYFYLKIMHFFGIVEIKNAYTPKTLKIELSKEFQKQFQALIDKDNRFKNRLEQLASELNTTYQELVVQIKAYIAGQKVKLEQPVRELAAEIKRTIKANYRLNLSY